jgi:hypothetical protein
MMAQYSRTDKRIDGPIMWFPFYADHFAEKLQEHHLTLNQFMEWAASLSKAEAFVRTSLVVFLTSGRLSKVNHPSADQAAGCLIVR